MQVDDLAVAAQMGPADGQNVLFEPNQNNNDAFEDSMAETASVNTNAGGRTAGGGEAVTDASLLTV